MPRSKSLPKLVCSKPSDSDRQCGFRGKDGACNYTSCGYNINTTKLTVGSLNLLVERIRA